MDFWRLWCTCTCTPAFKHWKKTTVHWRPDIWINVHKFSIQLLTSNSKNVEIGTNGSKFPVKFSKKSENYWTSAKRIITWSVMGQQTAQAKEVYSRVFPSVWSVLSQCYTRLKLLHFLYDTEVMWRKTIKQAFSIFSNKTWVFDQSERAQSIKWKNKLYQSKVCPRLSLKSGQKAWFSAQRECPVHLLVRALCNKQTRVVNMTQRLTMLMNLLSKMTFFSSYDRLRKHQ